MKEIATEVTFEELLERKNNYKGISPENQTRIQQTYDNIKDVQSVKATRVVLLSDYDCDGICSALIMKKIFPEAEVIIGDRFKDGYGVPNVNLRRGDLVICTDIGSSDVMKLMNIATQTGISPYVIDHHEKDEYTKLYEENSPLRVVNFTGEKDAPDYCGTGLALKLYECDYFRRLADGVAKEDMDKELATVQVIGMIGTVADMVSVNNPHDENREIIQNGFKILKDVFEGKKEIDETLRVFLEMCGVDENVQNITTKTIGFDVAPPINALGRLESYGGQKAFDSLSEPLFTADGKVKESVFTNLSHIKEVNELRKNRMKAIMESPSVKNAIKDAENDDVRITVLIDRDIEQGLTGLVANKIRETTGKPAVVLTESEEGLFIGSGRNADGYPSLYENARNEYCLRAGGHEGAIGLSIEKENFEDYVNAVKDRYKKIEPVCQREYLKLQSIKDLTVEKFLQLEPFGTDFPAPTICTDAVRIENKTNLPRKNPKPEWANTTVDGVKFSDWNNGNKWHEGDVVRIVATPEYSEFGNKPHLEYLIKGMKDGNIKELSKDDVKDDVKDRQTKAPTTDKTAE